MLSRRDQDFAAAVARSSGLELVDVREIAGLGIVNHVFVITDTNQERWVVRLPRDPLDENVYACEAWCLQAAYRHRIPVASLHSVGVLHGIPFIVQSFVEGESGDCRRSSDLWRTLGSYARLVNNISLDDAPEGLFGRFGRDPRANWLAHVDYNLGQLRTDDPLIELNVYTPSQQRILRRCFEEVRDQVNSFGLCHGDLVPKNVLLPPAGKPTLIDWGSARVGPTPFRDYLRIVAADLTENFVPEDLQAFAAGYGTELTAVLPVALKIHVLNRIDLVRWALDRRRDRIAAIADCAKQTVAQYVGAEGMLIDVEMPTRFL